MWPSGMYQNKVCAHAKFYVPTSKNVINNIFLNFLALHNHRKRCDHVVQHNQYGTASTE